MIAREGARVGTKAAAPATVGAPPTPRAAAAASASGMAALALAALGLALAPGCGGCDGDGSDEPAPTFEQCASAAPAYVREATLALLGRRPASQHEVDALVALYEQVEAARAAGTTTELPRAVVARALLARPEKLERWTVHWMDALRVARIEDQAQDSCYGDARRATVDGVIAGYLRDHPATATGTGEPFTMLDVVRSAVALDDVTPIYRGHLFALVSRPIVAANVPDVEAELARRADFGAVFDATYLNRDIVCLGCHNSQAAITDRDEPELDRHWPLAGHVDRALYGDSTGIDPARAHAPFRVDGFLLDRSGRTPWGMATACGRFTAPAAVGDDLAEIDGHFGSLTGRRLTAFDLDAALARGFAAIRGVGLTVAADGTVADPDAAFAYMVAASAVESVWREVVGTPLTIANYFPRNQAQRDVLQTLTDRFVASGFSLDALLVDIVTSDYFSRLPPEAACGAHPYTYPAIFDPWVIDDEDASRRGNGPGDAVTALSPRTLLSAAYAGLEWRAPPGEQFPSAEDGCDQLSCSELGQACQFGFCCETYAVTCQGRPPSNEPDELPFQRAIGVFLKNGERGFRGLDFQARLAWEDRFGTCAPPARVTGPDLVDRALAAAAAVPDATVGDVVALLKDRLVGEPVDPDHGEPAAIAALVGQPLDAPAAALTEAAARRFCGALLSSPQFVLGGVAGRGGPPPRLTLPGDGFDDACARVAAVELAGWRVTCAPGSLTATPVTAP